MEITNSKYEQALTMLSGACSLLQESYKDDKQQVYSISTLSDTAFIRRQIEETEEGTKLTLPKRTYIINETIEVTKNISIDFNDSIFESYSANAFVFRGTLKSTHKVTTNYIATISKNSLVLDLTTGIEIGDLINVRSTELYDTSREYYFKGGSAIVTNIIENTVYFNMVFPFNMASDTITVRIYKPISITLENIGLLNGKQALGTSIEGIRVEYGKNIIIKNVTTNNFQSNIFLERCVNTSLDFIDTKIAKAHIEADPPGYGICIFSCTTIRLTNINTNSGQHGITTTGKEPCYGLNIQDSTLKSEVWNMGFGAHENIWDSTFINVKFFGALFCGNFEAINCEFWKSDALLDKSIQLQCAEKYSNANFNFTSCRFNDSEIILGDSSQQPCPTRKYVGSMTFKKCSDLKLRLGVGKDENSKVAEVKSITIEDCDNYSFSSFDKVEDLVVSNSRASQGFNIIEQRTPTKQPKLPILPIPEVFRRIENITLKNLTHPLVYANLKIRNANIVTIDGFKYDTSADYGQSNEIFSDIDTLYLTHYNNATAQRGIEITSLINKLVMIDCDIKFFRSMATQLANVTRVEAKGIKVGDEYMDIITSTDGKKFKVQIDSTGTQVLTEL